MADIDIKYLQPIIDGVSLAGDFLGNLIPGNTEWGRVLGSLTSSLGQGVVQNLFKGLALTAGLGLNALSSLGGTAAGLASYGIGYGLNALGGDTPLSRGISTGISTGLGTLGGTALQGAILGVKVGEDTAKGLSGASAALKSINPLGLGMSMLGTGLSAALGPSKEYGGRHGIVTQTADTIYDLGATALGLVPGGQIASGILALNKGLSNIFGSTDGMTVQDAILGSAFMPFPIKWFNMIGAKTTSTFNNLSWQNSLKANSFMGNAFGNLNDKFDKAREEAGKTYGTFSRGAYYEALNNINFANNAWNKVLGMANLNTYQNIRSLDMSSINNLKYASNISGRWTPLTRGKYGMKIFNNATNHNIGMRLLSGAALIDNKQMILCSAVD